MALSFSNVETILRSRLTEASAATWEDSELQDYLYLAEIKVLQLLPTDLLWDIVEVQESTEADVSHGYVALPSSPSMLKLVNIEQGNSDGPTRVRSRVIEPGRKSEYAESTEQPVCWFEDGKLYFFPDIAGEFTQVIKFRYVPMPTEGSILVTDRLVEYVVSWAYAMAIERESTQLAAVEKNEFYQNIAMLQEQSYNINNLSGSR